MQLRKHLRLFNGIEREPNLTPHFDPEDLKALGAEVRRGYEEDELSRSVWYARTSAAMDLALQVSKTKTFPFQNCSNVAFPLVTIAALQFHSRAYPEIVRGKEVVKMRALEPGQSDRAARVGAHMSWQLLEQDEDWEEGLDRLLINLPIVGCAFKKSTYDPNLRRNRSELVLAKDLVLDYYAKSVESCERKTHVYPMYRNEMFSRMLRGVFRDLQGDEWFRAPAAVPVSQKTVDEDRRQGEMAPTNPSDLAPYTLLEQHCWFDFDGDGIAEPYIITVEWGTATVLRIVPRWSRPESVERLADGRIIGFVPEEYFTKYSFIPAADGGVYDIGFGVLLGPLNEAVNSIVNQLVDAGTISNTAGGFLGRGAKLRGGEYVFRPFGWQPVDAPGDDLRKNLVPLPVREPSRVLFDLLGLIINFTNRIPGTTETMVGENPGQNTPATTTQTMVEQGIKVFGAIYKRVWRALKQEFKKLYILNAVHLPPQGKFPGGATRDDYLGSPDAIIPAADPEVASQLIRLQRVMAMKQDAHVTPGYNIQAVTEEYLKTLGVEDVAKFYPGPEKTGPLPNPKLQAEQVKAQVAMQRVKLDMLIRVQELQEEARLNAAKIVELHARAANEMAQAGGVQTGHAVAAFEAAVGALKAHQDGVLKQIELMTRQLNEQSTNGGGMDGMAPPSGDQGIPPMGASGPGAG